MSPAENEILIAAELAFEQSESTIDKLSEFIEAKSSYSMGSFADTELYVGLEPIIAIIDELRSTQIKLAESAASDAVLARNQQLLIVFSTALTLSLLSIALGVWLVIGLKKDITQLNHVITEVEQSKHLKIRVNIKKNDEFGDMGRRFDRMMDTFSEVISGSQVHGKTLTEVSLTMSAQGQQAKAQCEDQLNALKVHSKPIYSLRMQLLKQQFRKQALDEAR